MGKGLVPGPFFSNDFSRFIRREIKRHKIEKISKEFDVPISTLYKWGAGQTQPSVKHFLIYEEFLRRRQEESAAEVAANEA